MNTLVHSFFSHPFFTNIYTFLFTICIAIVGYLAPIKHMIVVVVALVLLDMVFGIWASMKAGYGLKSIKAWRTLEKLLISAIILIAFFAIDQEMGGFVELHRIAGWLIAGVEMWSILESTTRISNNKLFKILKQFMHDKIESQTGVDVK